MVSRAGGASVGGPFHLEVCMKAGHAFLGRHAAVVPCVFVAALAACEGAEPAEEELLGEAEDAAVCPDVSGTLVERSLAVTDAEVLAKFSFSRVMNRVRSTANAGASPTTTNLFKAWMGTFGDTAATGNCNDPEIDPNGYGLVCPRVPEAKLATINPFAAGATVTFQPVAVM